MSNEELIKLKTLVNGNRYHNRSPVVRVVRDYNSIISDEDWCRRFPKKHFFRYHEFLQKYSNRPVTVDKVLDSGAILLSELSIAIGLDVLQDENFTYLPEELFEI